MIRKILTEMYKIIHPSKWVLLILPPVAFGCLIFIFAEGKSDTVPAYIIYGVSAYSLIILLISFPASIKQIRTWFTNRKTIQKIKTYKIIGRYIEDLSFRGTISIYQGMMINFLYVIFRIIVGIKYMSVWFISMAVYYLFLGILRTYLIICYRRDQKNMEIICYKRTALFIFLLNIPMGIMIFLMVETNSGYSYSGYIIYLSAIYTFYTLTTSIINLFKFKKLGNPLLSAAKVLNFISAMMSILGLQTAMISRFSKNGDEYRKMMNAITGGFVYGSVIIIAVYMLIHSKKLERK